jgi:HK97 family phage major capsid protein
MELNDLKKLAKDMEIEQRSFLETVTTEKRELTPEEKTTVETRTTKLDEVLAEIEATEKRDATLEKAKSINIITKENKMEKRELIEEMYNHPQRAFAIGTNGEKEVFTNFFEESAALAPLVDKATVQRGFGSNNVSMSLISPSVGITRADENKSNFSVDTAAWAPLSVVLYPYASDIPVTDAFMQFEKNPEAMLKASYARSLAAKLGVEMVSGTLYDQGTGGAMLGVSGDAGITQHVHGTEGGIITLADLYSAIDTALVNKQASQLTFVTSPGIMAKIRELDTYGKVVQVENGKKFIEGIEVVLSSGITATAAANATDVVMGVIGDFSEYAIGVANEMKVSYLPPAAGNLNAHIRILSYINGAAVAKSNFWKLLALHAS